MDSEFYNILRDVNTMMSFTCFIMQINPDGIHDKESAQINKI